MIKKSLNIDDIFFIDVILIIDNVKKLAHPISWYWIIAFVLWMVHNVFVLNRKVNIDKMRKLSNQFNAISRLYPKGTYISRRH
mgnify:CR=1 FL=1